MAEHVISEYRLDDGTLIVQVIGEGHYRLTRDMNPDDSGEFVGKVVGLKYLAKSAKALEDYDVDWYIAGEKRSNVVDRVALERELRVERNKQRDRNASRVDVVRRKDVVPS